MSGTSGVVDGAATRFDVEAGVATLTIDRPARRNVLDDDVKRGLADGIARVRDTPAIRALVLTGAGGVFCAGGDLRGMGRHALAAEERHRRMSELHATVIGPLLALDRPVVAAVDGAAYGGGFGLALAADFVLASPRARFCMSFLRVGLVPDSGAWFTLPRVVGYQRAKELMLTAREVDAHEALALGIALELHAPETLLTRAQAFAGRFTSASPSAVAATKAGLDRASRADLGRVLADEADVQTAQFFTDAHRDAVARFLDKRPAAFRWPAPAETNDG